MQREIHRRTAAAVQETCRDEREALMETVREFAERLVRGVMVRSHNKHAAHVYVADELASHLAALDIGGAIATIDPPLQGLMAQREDAAESTAKATETANSAPGGDGGATTPDGLEGHTKAELVAIAAAEGVAIDASGVKANLIGAIRSARAARGS